MLEAQDGMLVIQSEGRSKRRAGKSEVRPKSWLEEGLEEKRLSALEKPQFVLGKREATPRAFTEIDDSIGNTFDSRR